MRQEEKQLPDLVKMVDGNTVCISFNRWEDTIRHSFISHLSAEFHRKSIYVSTGQNSDAAIAKAKVSLVILSEKSVSNYRFLNELVKVSACRSSHGLLVVPVFYGLTKSVLRKYCLLLKKMYPEDQVADWRNALLDIADLRGYASSLERRWIIVQNYLFYFLMTKDFQLKWKLLKTLFHTSPSFFNSL